MKYSTKLLNKIPIILILLSVACKKEALIANTNTKSNISKIHSNTLTKQSSEIPKDNLEKWYGIYKGKFLRLEGESADPRGWATVDLNIQKDSVFLHIFSYVEEEKFSLKLIKADDKTIEFKMQPDENIKLIKFDKRTFTLHFNYIKIRNAEKKEVKLTKAK